MIDLETVVLVAAGFGGERGVEPAFIEKDWYAHRALRHLIEYTSLPAVHYSLVFAGGTSLSKAYNLTRRFSEDLDFLAIRKDGQPEARQHRAQRRAFRKGFAARLREDATFQLPPEGMRARNESKFFQARAAYPAKFTHPSLREHVQLEVTFDAPRYRPSLRTVRSAIGEATGRDDGVALLAVDPIETAGDKLSALSWRTLAKAGGQELDMTFVRHVHDIGTLADVIAERPDVFVEAATASLGRDRAEQRGHLNPDMSLAEQLDRTREALRAPYFRDAYDAYVQQMSYAPAEFRLGYDQALRHVVDAIALVVSN